MRESLADNVIVSHLDMPSNHADRPTEGQNDTPRSLDLSVIDPELLAMSGTLPDDERDEEQTEGDDSRILVSTFIHPGTYPELS